MLVAAADPVTDLRLLADLFEFRFHLKQDSDLRNMAMGNLILTAYATVLGDFDQAVEAVARVLSCRAKILPSRPLPSRSAHASPTDRRRGESSTTRHWKVSHRRAVPGAERGPGQRRGVQVIREADLIVLGPGGLDAAASPGVLPSPVRDAHPGSAEGILPTSATPPHSPGQMDGFDTHCPRPGGAT